MAHDDRRRLVPETRESLRAFLQAEGPKYRRPRSERDLRQRVRDLVDPLEIPSTDSEQVFPSKVSYGIYTGGFRLSFIPTRRTRQTKTQHRTNVTQPPNETLTTVIHRHTNDHRFNGDIDPQR